jgi:hypothetical protein
VTNTPITTINKSKTPHPHTSTSRRADTHRRKKKDQNTNERKDNKRATKIHLTTETQLDPHNQTHVSLMVPTQNRGAMIFIRISFFKMKVSSYLLNIQPMRYPLKKIKSSVICTFELSHFENQLIQVCKCVIKENIVWYNMK